MFGENCGVDASGFEKMNEDGGGGAAGGSCTANLRICGMPGPEFINVADAPVGGKRSEMALVKFGIVDALTRACDPSEFGKAAFCVELGDDAAWRWDHARCSGLGEGDASSATGADAGLHHLVLKFR